MGNSDKEKLNRILCEHLNTIHETLQVLHQNAAPSLGKESWSNVVNIGEELSKKATTVGMLWTGEIPKVEVLEENMTAYFNLLQGFLLISHGSTVGAGSTLYSFIHESEKQVVESSFTLMKECVDSYGSRHGSEKQSIPKLVGRVWEACAALKKTPSTNVTAIGRALTKITVTMKDVLREMKELKPASSDPVDEVDEENDAEEDEIETDGSDEDLGSDLSEEEMKIAQLTAEFVSETIAVVNNLVRVLIGLLKREYQDDLRNSIDALENVLKFCKAIGAQVDELGACLYPPQEIHVMKAALEKISSSIDNVKAEFENLGCSSEDFVQSCNSLGNTLRWLETELSSSEPSEVIHKMEKLGVNE